MSDIDPDDLTDLHVAAVAVQEAIGVLVERLEVLLPEPELEPESEPVPDAERFKAEVPAEPTRRLTVDLPESLHRVPGMETGNLVIGRQPIGDPPPDDSGPPDDDDDDDEDDE